MDKRLAVGGRSFSVATCFLLMCAAGLSQDAVHYTSRQLHQMMQHARTSEDYQRLALYFMGEERSYLLKAQSEQKTYSEALKSISAARNPTRAETAKGMAQYYTSKADQAAKVAALYEEKLAATKDAAAAPKRGSAVQSKLPPEPTPSEKLINERLEELERQMQQMKKP